MLDGEGMDGWTNKQMMEGVINAMGLKMETSGKDSAGLGGKKKKKRGHLRRRSIDSKHLSPPPPRHQHRSQNTLQHLGAIAFQKAPST